MISTKTHLLEVHIYCKAKKKIIHQIREILGNRICNKHKWICIESKSYITIRSATDECSKSDMLSLAVEISKLANRIVFFMFSQKNNFSFEAFKNGENCISLEAAFFNGKHSVEFNNMVAMQMPFSIESFQKKMKMANLYGNPIQTAYEMLNLDFNRIVKFPEGYVVNTETSSKEILYYENGIKPTPVSIRDHYQECDNPFRTAVMLDTFKCLPDFKCNVFGMLDSSKKQYVIPKAEDGMYRKEDRKYFTIESNGCISLTNKYMRGACISCPNFAELEYMQNNWHGDCIEGYQIFGIDMSGLYYANCNSYVYIVDVQKLEYSKVHILGEVNAWYLNKSGEMCVITNNHGFEKNAANNILRIYVFQKVEG